MTTRTIEYRTGGAPLLRTRPTVEQRADGIVTDDAPNVFVGQPIVYNARTLIGRLPWGWYEEIDPGVLGTQLTDADVTMLWNHNSGYPISRTSAGTLRLTNTPTALEAESDLNELKSYVRDLIANLNDGTVKGMSFGFWVTEDEWSEIEIGKDPDGRPIRADLRRIKAIELIEISPVTFPAFEQTTAGLRASCEAIRESRKQIVTTTDPAGIDRASDIDPDDQARLARFLDRQHAISATN